MAGLAYGAAQLVEQEVTARDFVTTQRGAFELRDRFSQPLTDLVSQLPGYRIGPDCIGERGR